MQLPGEDRYLMTKEELQNKLTILLAGRAAEFLFFHQVSTGATDDLVKATNIARNMIMQYGMDETLGHVVYDQSHPSILRTPTALNPHPREFSEKTAQKIDLAVQALIQKAFDDATSICKAHKNILIKGAELLLKKETLSEEDIADLFIYEIPAGAGSSLDN